MQCQLGLRALRRAVDPKKAARAAEEIAVADPTADMVGQKQLVKASKCLAYWEEDACGTSLKVTILLTTPLQRALDTVFNSEGRTTVFVRGCVGCARHGRPIICRRCAQFGVIAGEDG